MITSRIGIQREAPRSKFVKILLYLNCIFVKMKREKSAAVLIDECQFLKNTTYRNWWDSRQLRRSRAGLRTQKNDFRNELFEGSYYMLIYADKIEEIKTICWCGAKKLPWWWGVIDKESSIRESR